MTSSWSSWTAGKTRRSDTRFYNSRELVVSKKPHTEYDDYTQMDIAYLLALTASLDPDAYPSPAVKAVIWKAKGTFEQRASVRITGDPT